MRMLIDNRDLELLLEKKKKFIGNKVTVDTMIAGISFSENMFSLFAIFICLFENMFASLRHD